MAAEAGGWAGLGGSKGDGSSSWFSSGSLDLWVSFRELWTKGNLVFSAVSVCLI